MERQLTRTDRYPVRDNAVWQSKPGDPTIQSPGDLPAMMVQGGLAPAKDGDDEMERRCEERAAEPPPRKAIISRNGQDVEECCIREWPCKGSAA